MATLGWDNILYIARAIIVLERGSLLPAYPTSREIATQCAE
ncbi:hypothetical protein [Serratia nevei]